MEIKTDLAIHNSSSILLTLEDCCILTKGLGFSPTPHYTTKDHIFLLQQYNYYSDKIRKAFNPKKALQYDHQTPENLTL